MGAYLVPSSPWYVILAQGMWPFPEVEEVRDSCRTHVWPLTPNRLRISKPGWSVVSLIFLSLG